MMLAVSVLVFFMIRLVPGDPIGAMLADAGSDEAREALQRKFGFDNPLPVQFLKWFGNLFHGDLGASLYGSNQKVTTIILEALPRTLSLAGLSFVIAIAIALPAGIISALKRNTSTDTAVSLFAFLGLSMPDFWLAILLIIVFAANLQLNRLILKNTQNYKRNTDKTQSYQQKGRQPLQRIRQEK